MVSQFKNLIRSNLIKLLPINNPDFIIVGAQKAGTTSLHFYLSQHPDLFGSIPKEIHYFDIECQNGKSQDWYKKHFRSRLIDNKKHFESTPSYIYHERVARQISLLYPNIKLIVILREPVLRAFSAWNMYRDYFEKKDFAPLKRELNPGVENPIYKYLIKGRTEFPTFQESIEIELDLIEKAVSDEPAILRRGLYYEQLNKYYDYFEKDQLLILGFNDLVSRMDETMHKVFDFVGVNYFDVSLMSKTAKNKIDYNTRIKDNDNKLLNEFYAEPNKKLFELLGYKPNW